MHIFHKWDKWKQYQTRFTVIPYDMITLNHNPNLSYEASETRQKRTCKICGKMQDKLIKKR